MLLQDISCLVGALGMQHGSTVPVVIWIYWKAGHKLRGAASHGLLCHGAYYVGG